MTISNAIERIQGWIAPVNQAIQPEFNKAYKNLSVAVSQLSSAYLQKVVIPGSNAIAKIVGEANQDSVKTLLKVLPIAVAFLVAANPISLTSGFLGYALIGGLVLVGTQNNLFSAEGRNRVFQGTSLGFGIQALAQAVKLAVYGFSGTGIAAFAGSMAFSAALYYASNSDGR